MNQSTEAPSPGPGPPAGTIPSPPPPSSRGPTEPGPGAAAPPDGLATKESAERTTSASRWYILPMLAIIGLMVAMLAYEYGRNALPPGVDPGHWLSTAYAYVGLPTANDPANQPLFYSPLIFPFLGGLVLLTRNPVTAATIFAALLLFFYGLTVVHAARRFLRTGTVQVALVGVALLCGTTFQMLFWGAYPNYMGFIFLNESLIFFLLFVRDRRTLDAAFFFVALGLTYFAHDLSFYVLVASLVACVVLLLLLRQIPLRFLVDPRVLVGLFSVIAVVEGYGIITARLGIPHPSYLFSNPSAYVLDEVGEIFSPLGHSPAFWPPGTVVYLSPLLTVAILLSASVFTLIGLGVLKWLRPDRLSVRLTVAAGWLCGAAAVPALGYLAHVDTDYTRFLYFLPLPFALVVAVGLENALAPVVALGAPLPRTAARDATARRRFRRLRREKLGEPLIAASFVALLLTVMFFTVTIPVAQGAELSGAGGYGHSPTFVDATTWLRNNPAPGAVLTQSQVARWTEALTNRPEYTVGPVWLLFDPFQVVDTEETYWAANSAYAITNSQVVLSYSGFNTSVFSQAPLYSSYVQGVPFPVFRVVPGGLILNVTARNGTENIVFTGGLGGNASTAIHDSGNGTILYQSWAADVIEVGTPLAGGQAEIQFVVSPHTGVTVHWIGVTLDRPPYGARSLQRGTLTALDYGAGGSLNWSIEGRLGQYPSPVNVTTTIQFSEPAVQQGGGAFANGSAWRGLFPDAHGTSPFVLTLAVSTPSTSNPAQTLPRIMSSAGFYQNQSIHFVLWTNSPFYAEQLYYFEAQFGFRPVYANVNWIILER